MVEQASIKIGTTILLVGGILNLIPGIGSLVYISLGFHAPALSFLFTNDEILNLGERTLATTDSIAILLNSFIVAAAIMQLFLVFFGIRKLQKWAFGAVLISTIIIQVASYTADYYMGNTNFLLNILSTIIMSTGLGFSWYGILKDKKN